MKYTLKYVIGIAQFGLLLAQDAEYRPAHAASDAIEVDGDSVEVEALNPEDFSPAKNGELSHSDALDVAELKAALEAALAQVPEGEKGQGHDDFSAYQQLVTSFQIIATTKDRDSLFATVPVILPVFSPSENRGIELSHAGMVASGIRDVYIREVAFEVLENSANIPQAKHDRFVNLFCNRAILQEPDWEENPPPIDPAGVFIVDENNATINLKAKGLKEIETFSSGNIDNSFFERYEATGDGMDVLKTKYAANKAAIQAKFAEVLAHVAQLASQQQNQ
jgi:hypothetical protein